MNMNLDFNTWIKKARSLTQGGTKITFNPMRDWLVALLLALLISFGFAYYAFIVFAGLSTGEIIVGLDATPPAPPIDAEDMQHALTGITERKTGFEIIKTAPPSVPSPSR